MHHGPLLPVLFAAVLALVAGSVALWRRPSGHHVGWSQAHLAGVLLGVFVLLLGIVLCGGAL